MTTIDGLGSPAAAPPARRARPVAGFALPPEAAAANGAPPPAEAAGSAPVFAAFMEGLLGLQELSADAAAVPALRDREARRRGQALLAALGEMQLMLAGDGPPGSLARLCERLAALADAVPGAADPRLGAVLAAIVLRARVELARFAS